VVEDFIACKRPREVRALIAQMDRQTMIVSNLRGVRVGEVWFDEEPNFSAVDVLRYYCRSNPLDGIPFQESWTILVDLTKDESCILTAFKRAPIRGEARRDTRSITYYAHAGRVPAS